MYPFFVIVNTSGYSSGWISALFTHGLSTQMAEAVPGQTIPTMALMTIAPKSVWVEGTRATVLVMIAEKPLRLYAPERRVLCTIPQKILTLTL